MTLRAWVSDVTVTLMDSPLGHGMQRITRPSHHWRRVGKRFGIGHRAAFLMGMGLIFISLGLGILLSESAGNPLLYHTQLPEMVRVGLWCGCGMLALAFARDRKWQWIGFSALALPAFERFSSYSVAIIRDAFDGGGPPVPWPFLNGAFLYFAILFITRLAASWPDPPGDDYYHHDAA